MQASLVSERNDFFYRRILFPKIPSSVPAFCFSNTNEFLDYPYCNCKFAFLNCKQQCFDGFEDGEDHLGETGEIDVVGIEVNLDENGNKLHDPRKKWPIHCSSGFRHGLVSTTATDDDCTLEAASLLLAEKFASRIHCAMSRARRAAFAERNLTLETSIDGILYEKAENERPPVRRHLAALLKFVFAQRTADLATSKIVGGASMFYAISLRTAQCLREALKLYNWEMISAVTEAHCWLLKNLPVCLLTSYLNLLRFLRIVGSNLTAHILTECEQLKQFVNAATPIVREFVERPVAEPVPRAMFQRLVDQRLADVHFIFVHPQIETNVHSIAFRPCESLFMDLLPRIVGSVDRVQLKLNYTNNMEMSAELCALASLQLLETRLRRILAARLVEPNQRVFLVGWGTSCLLNHMAILRIGGISGLLNFAFPVLSAGGPRGDVEDSICLSYCPTLFVVGEDAADSNVESLQYLRANMCADTGLAVVGEANHNLLVSQTRLNIERLSQKAINVNIVEHVVDFIKLVKNNELSSAEYSDNGWRRNRSNHSGSSLLKPLDFINGSDRVRSIVNCTSSSTSSLDIHFVKTYDPATARLFFTRQRLSDDSAATTRQTSVPVNKRKSGAEEEEDDMEADENRAANFLCMEFCKQFQADL